MLSLHPLFIWNISDLQLFWGQKHWHHPLSWFGKTFLETMPVYTYRTYKYWAILNQLISVFSLYQLLTKISLAAKRYTFLYLFTIYTEHFTSTVYRDFMLLVIVAFLYSLHCVTYIYIHTVYRHISYPLVYRFFAYFDLSLLSFLVLVFSSISIFL